MRRPEKNRRERKQKKGMPFYEDYSMNWKERGVSIGLAAILAGTAAYSCYRSWLVFAALLIPAGVCPRFVRQYQKKKRLEKLEAQFKEMIQILSSSLSAGYSVENAVAACRKELELMYGSDGLITKEAAYMVQQMEMNRPIEALINELADRSGLEEVENFARIFTIAKRSGGRLVPIIAHTVQIMNDRFQVKEEIRTLTASRKFEQKIMNLMPVLMILYIDGTSPGFFTVMYTTAMGRIVMTGCLMVYLSSVYLSGKILDIQVG